MIYRFDYTQELNNLRYVLYNKFKNLESLNYIFIGENQHNTINIELEFYEGQYLLETLNDPDYAERMFNKIKHSLIPIRMRVNIVISLIQKKRIKYDREDIDELIYFNKKPEILYDTDIQINM